MAFECEMLLLRLEDAAALIEATRIVLNPLLSPFHASTLYYIFDSPLNESFYGLVFIFKLASLPF
jgi:hypothetical protein